MIEEYQKTYYTSVRAVKDHEVLKGSSFMFFKNINTSHKVDEFFRNESITEISTLQEGINWKNMILLLLEQEWED
jgi:hypothetical protein